jgi:superfamily I DNA and/or RNA helicase
MIYDKNKSCWTDKTNQVQWFSEDEHSIRIKFFSSQKFYFKSYKDMYIVKTPKQYNAQEEMYFNGHKLLNYQKVIKFNDWVKVFYKNNTTRVLRSSEITSLQELKLRGGSDVLRFNYYNELAQVSGTFGNGFLASMYDNLDLKNTNTILYKFLSKRRISKVSPLKEYIYPFGLNLSQKKAVENSFTYDLSVIEGPPGTGKTQTILNIISNAIYQNKTVAVVSNNNAAIENIQSKLEEYNLDFLTALLGNKENKTQFFDNTINKNKPLEYLGTKEYKDSNSKLFELITKYKYELPKLYQAENRVALLQEKFNAYTTEFDYFKRDNSFIDNDITVKLSKKISDSEHILRLKASIEHGYHYSWIKKLVFRFKNGFNVNKLNDENVNNIMTFLDMKYYSHKLLEISMEIDNLNNYLKTEGFVEAKNNYVNVSKEVLKRKLYRKYSNLRTLEYTYENYRNSFSDFINEYPIVLSTSYALIPSADKGYVFDYLIIDEASQTDLLSSVLAMSCAERLVVVGDTKQLPQIENQSLFNVNEELKESYRISSEYDYFNNNILTSVLKLYNNIPRVLLKEHYRCHPKIIGFCNQKFYNNELIILTETKSDKEPLKIYQTVAGNHARKNPNGSGWYNQREIDEIKVIVEGISTSTIGVITPYNYQARLLQDSLKQSCNIEVDTVHKFQGRAKDVIILSTVANELNNVMKDDCQVEDFVARSDLLNVAISRAKEQLNLVVSDKLFHSKNNSISDLVKYIKYNSSSDSISKGNVKSIFDLLYSDYQKELQQFRSKNKTKGFDSENLASTLINKVISDSNTNTLKVLMHYPLKNLINNKVGLTKRELSYVSHKWSHVDFVIVNTLTKEHVLVIEVDGVSFHEQNIKQSERDEIKNKVLNLNEIPLLRLKTNESNEESRIITALKTSLNL